ncbi:MAG: hypothetical protein ACYS4T_13695 [Planctomycetota bacterium]
MNNLIDKPYLESVRQELSCYLAEWEAETPGNGKTDVVRSFNTT